MEGSDDEILSLVTFGGLLIFMATIFLIMHLLFLAVNMKKCGFESNFAYTLMCLISILDCIQLLIHCITGVIVCFKVRMPLMKVIGAFMESSWILMGISTVFLSFHRFIFTALSEKAESIITSRFSKVSFSILLTSYFSLLIFLLSPYCSFMFSAELYWYFQPDYVYSWIGVIMDAMSSLGAALLNTLFYSVTFAVLFLKYPLLRHTSELRLTLLVFPQSGYQVLCFSICEFVIPIIPPRFYIRYIVIVLWVVWNSIGPLIYLMFCPSFRRELKELLCKLMVWRKKKNGYGNRTVAISMTPFVKI
ncbi:hypothetical protein V3C99_001782 [Haemonchus contortus]